MATLLITELPGEIGTASRRPVVALPPLADAPATHYISSGPISDGMAALLPCKSVTKDAEGLDVITTTPGMPAAVPALASKAGITTTLAKINTLYSNIDVSDQPPFEALSRLGLQIVRGALP